MINDTIFRELRSYSSSFPSMKRSEVFLLDIRTKSFAAQTGAVTSDLLIHALNDKYCFLLDLAEKHEGTISLFNGDQIQIMFGGGSASSLSERIFSAVHDISNQNPFLTTVIVQSRIGIAFGKVSYGFFGNAKHSSFQVVGDLKKRAELLCDRNEWYGTSVICCDRSASLLSSHFTLRELDAIQWRGKNYPNPIYEILLS